MKKKDIQRILKTVALRSEMQLKPIERVETDFTPPPLIDTSAMNHKDKLRVWRNGGAGFIQWCNDNVNLAIYEEGSDIPRWIPMSDMPKEKNPMTDRSYQDCWDMQKPILMEALQMKNGRFKYRVIVLCWMRGDGKSLIACLIQLWKFFCFPKQSIMLGANSKDQVKFVHYDIMREIIQNSPKLLATVGERNIQEKEIRLQNSKGVTISIIRSISSFSGIVSNITGYTFSEIFDMKNPKFFVQLDGSTRNMPNALGIIDSTVSAKTHILYKLYQSSLEKKHGSLTFFSYRCSKEASYKDFFNPQMTQLQLDDYRMKFPPAEFDRYFRNVWESGVGKVFSEDMVDAVRILSVLPNGAPQPNTNMIQRHLEETRRLAEVAELKPQDQHSNLARAGLIRNVRPVSHIYRLDHSTFFNSMATSENLRDLSQYYETDWVIGASADRADPMKVVTYGARTIVTIFAKGLPGSKFDRVMQYSPHAINSYLYVALCVAHIQDNTLEGIKQIVNLANIAYDGLDMFCAERWGMFDIVPWLEENEIKFELIQPNIERQRMAFTELYTVVATERFKCPPLGIHGSKMDDILKEEMLTFEQDQEKVWYGSPEKTERYGIQDDVIFSSAWGIYGMRNLTVADFRTRGIAPFAGMYYENKEVHGRY